MSRTRIAGLFAAAGAAAVLLGLIDGSLGLVGCGLLMWAIAGYGGIRDRMVRDHDGERVHGAYYVGLGLLLAAAASLILFDPDVTDLWNGLVLRWLVAPGSVVVSIYFWLLGLRLVIIPAPNRERDRRRRKPHRQCLGIPDSSGGFMLRPSGPAANPWPLPPWAIANIQRVGESRRGKVTLRVQLKAPLDQYGPPMWVSYLLMDRQVLEFAVSADVAPERVA